MVAELEEIGSKSRNSASQIEVAVEVEDESSRVSRIESSRAARDVTG
jgi:hypothetical protein